MIPGDPYAPKRVVKGGSFRSTLTTARVIAPARDTERHPIPDHCIQVFGALFPETMCKLVARLPANLLVQNRRLLAQTTPKLMKYKRKVVSYGLSVPTATAGSIGARDH